MHYHQPIEQLEQVIVDNDDNNDDSINSVNANSEQT